MPSREELHKERMELKKQMDELALIARETALLTEFIINEAAREIDVDQSEWRRELFCRLMQTRNWKQVPDARALAYLIERVPENRR